MRALLARLPSTVPPPTAAVPAPPPLPAPARVNRLLDGDDLKRLATDRCRVAEELVEAMTAVAPVATESAM